MEQKSLTISAVQMCSKIGDKYGNFEKAAALISRDTDKSVDVIILPEVWTVGWNPRYFRQSAENIENCAVINFLSEIARKYNAYIIGGSFIEKADDETYYNTCPVLDRNGTLIAKYSKNHLYSAYGADESTYVKAGESPVMVDIDGIKTGITICYDIRFPEIFRSYRQSGAELLVNMAAWGAKKPLAWETLTRARAIENQAFMVALTQSGKITDDEWNIGHSRIFDYLGKTVTEIKDQKEGVMTISIDFSDMRKYRKECLIMNDLKKSYEVKYYAKVH